MKQPLKYLEEIVGKTVKAQFELDECIILAFTDGAWIALKSDVGYDGDRFAPEVDKEFGSPSHSVEKFVAAGIMTESDASEWRREKDARDRSAQQYQERQEREQLARLKAKYET